MSRTRIASCGMLLLLVAPAAGADVLELRDGRRLEGRLVASDGSVIRFETPGGTVAVPVAEAAALSFATPGATGVRTGAAAAPAPPTARIRAGTRLRVRVKDSLDPRRSTAGDRFAALVEAPIADGERVLVPARAVAYGVVSAASPTGPAPQQLRLELTELQIQGRRVPIVTGSHARVAEPPRDAAPAAAAGETTTRVPAGALLEFRLLQPVEF